ncbi:carboxymuconolactone decarboxylase family protein [Enterobacter huaxiensis]|uniref:Carboxymuconolactone decarboxylase family protein n=1 Tax=Enterobacter huaxiensis TaxID=2494702 RepID=A0A428LGP3_9ENTR|nr:carboxymuconolactone decarboxylase family protein [Enterobacter huaxiensis]RSK63133.1 carboxymuconolactone decarboxylase family protein [Enterobacter huaxiensis]
MLAKQDYPLTTQQKYMAFIATQAASGNMTGLNRALHQGLDNGLTISDCREILTQLYAYAGFPRSLNALTELMEVVNTRKVQGIQDVEGSLPGPMPKPDEMLAAGTQNQTALVGKPVKGPLFDFAPAAGEYLKTHLFGDIFSRDNLNWKSRELATVGALSAMEGVDPQLQAHLNMSMNTGIMYAQLAELVPFFEAQGEQVSANRLRVALNSVRTD